MLERLCGYKDMLCGYMDKWNVRNIEWLSVCVDTKLVKISIIVLLICVDKRTGMMDSK